MEEYKTQDSLYCIFFLQVKGKYIKDTYSLLRNTNFILEMVNQYANIEGVYYCIGKFDILVLLKGNDLGCLSRFTYKIIEFINSKISDAIIDFTKILLFKWDLKNIKISNEFPVSILKIKLKNPIQSFVNKDKTVIKELEILKNSFSIDVFGGFSWHEVVILIYGKNFECSTLFIDEIRNNKEISCKIGDISTIPVWNPENKYDKCEMTLAILLQVTNHSKFSSNKKVIYGEIYSSFGFIDFITYHNVESVNEIEVLLSHYQRLEDEYGIKKYSSILTFSKEKNNSKSFPIGAIDQRDDANQFPISRKCISDERLDALLIQLRCLANEKRFSYLIDQDLLCTLDKLNQRKNEIRCTNIEGFIATMEYVVLQRLIGTYSASSIGIVTGYIDRHGGFQRIILACECLLMRSMRIMTQGVLPTPKIFVIFNYIGSHQYDLDNYEVLLDIIDDAPIIIRLPTFKYEPWDWHRGIKKIARWCQELERVFRMKEFEHSLKHIRPDKDLNKDYYYVCKVIRKSYFKRLLAFEYEDSFVEKVNDEDKKFLFYKNRYSKLRNKLIQVKDLNDNCDYDEKKEASYRIQLINGVVQTNELKCDKNFIYFVNAYFSLELAERRKPKASSAFIISLYNSYKYIKSRS